MHNVVDIQRCQAWRGCPCCCFAVNPEMFTAGRVMAGSEKIAKTVTKKCRPEESFSPEPARLYPLPLLWAGAAQCQSEGVACHASCAPGPAKAKGQHVAVVLHHQSEKVLRKKRGSFDIGNLVG